MFFLEIGVNGAASSIRFSSIQVVTSGYFGRKSTQVVQESNYGTNRVWTNNPTFLLSGQLTGKYVQSWNHGIKIVDDLFDKDLIRSKHVIAQDIMFMNLIFTRKFSFAP